MDKTSNLPQNPPLQQTSVRRSVTITIPLHIAETLHGLVDGSMGSSEDDLFSEEMDIVRKKLDKAIDKHYA
jgi:hypothetical protein